MAQKTKGIISFQETVRILKAGGIAAIPTETVYGLAASIYSERGLRRIFQLKKRPLFDPLIVHCLNAEQAAGLTSGAIFPAEKLWERFAPGPLTLVLPKNDKVSPLITAGLETVALRIPSHPLMRRVLKASGVPLAAPSANLFSKTSPVCANHVLSAFRGRVPVLDGGPSAIGIESAVVRLDPRKKQLVILRPGAVPAADLKRCLKAVPWTVVSARPPALSSRRRAAPAAHPGGFKRHYAPPALLVTAESADSEKNLQIKLNRLYPGRAVRFLRLPRSSYEAARRLYHDMRVLSGEDPDAVLICAQKKPASSGKHQKGCWPAVWDRLQKAASRRLRFSP